MPPRKGSRRGTTRVIGNPEVEDGFGVWVGRYLEWLRVRNYSPRTIQSRESYLAFFVEWCEARNLERADQITRSVLQRYQRHVYYSKKRDGTPLSTSGQQARLIPIRAFYGWLSKQTELLENPAAELELPRQGRRLPPAVLSHEEAERVMTQPDLATLAGLRDRAVLETLYSSGVRRQELACLRVGDLDAERGTLFVRQGKGKKDRLLPIGERAIVWIGRYLDQARPRLLQGTDEGWLFVTTLGEQLGIDWLTRRVREYVKAGGIGKTGACHLFRHTMATVMLEGGADVRFVQEMLGHARLDSTQIYTQVSIRRLQAVHAATHPAAKLGRWHQDPAPDE